MNKKNVNIPPGTDLNKGLPPKQAAEELPEFTTMPDELFDDLPNNLRVATEQFKEPQEREVFLIGALGVLSGMLPNVHGVYFGRKVSPNLYCFVMGKYGTGKGALVWAKDLGEGVDAYRVQQANDAMAAHNEEQMNYHRQVKLYDKGKLATPPEQPKPPRHLKLYLPANSTKTAMMQLLMENDGRGIIFETEGDTLADMLRQDYGNFSDVLRKAFHHEPVSYFRRNNNEDVKINYPCLSVVLSGTDDQLRRLVPSIENGLFSRFCFYVLQGNAPFKDPFESDKYDLEAHFNRLAEHYRELYQKLERMDTPIYFTLQPHQKKQFVAAFNQQKEELREHISDDLEGTSNRLGLICFRIAMILTITRYAPMVSPGMTFTCSDDDFETATALTHHLVQYSLHVYEMLQQKGRNIPLAPMDDKQEKKNECCRNYGLGMSIREIAEHVLGDKGKSTTVFKWVKRYCRSA